MAGALQEESEEQDQKNRNCPGEGAVETKGVFAHLDEFIGINFGDIAIEHGSDDFVGFGSLQVSQIRLGEIGYFEKLRFGSLGIVISLRVILEKDVALGLVMENRRVSGESFFSPIENFTSTVKIFFSIIPSEQVNAGERDAEVCHLRDS